MKINSKQKTEKKKKRSKDAQEPRKCELYTDLKTIRDREREKERESERERNRKRERGMDISSKIKRVRTKRYKKKFGIRG